MFSSNLRVFAVTLLVLLSDVMERFLLPSNITVALVFPILRVEIPVCPTFKIGEVILVVSDVRLVVVPLAFLPMVIPVVVFVPIPTDPDVIVVELPAREKYLY